MGMHQQARDAFEQILAAAPDDPAILALMGHEYAVSGDKVNANRTLAKLTELSTRKYVPAVYFAAVYIGLNRKDDAFRWLDKAYDERCEYLVYLGTEPMADPLRGDPRFSRLLDPYRVDDQYYLSLQFELQSTRIRVSPSTLGLSL